MQEIHRQLECDVTPLAKELPLAPEDVYPKQNPYRCSNWKPYNIVYYDTPRERDNEIVNNDVYLIVRALAISFSPAATIPNTPKMVNLSIFFLFSKFGHLAADKVIGGKKKSPNSLRR